MWLITPCNVLLEEGMEGGRGGGRGGESIYDRVCHNTILFLMINDDGIGYNYDFNNITCIIISECLKS